MTVEERAKELYCELQKKLIVKYPNEADNILFRDQREPVKYLWTELSRHVNNSILDAERDMLNSCEEYGVFAARAMFEARNQKADRGEQDA